MSTLSISKLKGVGPKRLEVLKNNDLKTAIDLLNFFPVKYEDKSKIGYLDTITEEPITVKAKILNRGSIRYMGPNKNQLFLPIIDEKGNKGEVIFFNQPYLINQFKKDEYYYFYGKINRNHKKNQLFTPKFSDLRGSEDFLKITPVYKKIEGLSDSIIRSLIEQILENNTVKDFIPTKYLDENSIIDRTSLYNFLHHPKTREEIKKGIERLKFEEGLLINTGIIYYSNEENTDIVIDNFDSVIPFIRQLPFDLTDAQDNALKDIFSDLKSGKTMNRMIEGDVGSGKTIIAVIASYLMALNGLQTAYMAPTDILAQQHYETFRKLLESFDIRVALLTGSLSKSESEAIRDKIKKGEVQVIIGTHALIQENTQFYNLGLIVTDEQHRFGVKQRGQFELKGNPHTLVMSATPIPRTLALTLYGDLDLTVINELPKGRQKISTYFYTNKKMKNILDFIAKEIEKGHQAFIVCPFVEDSEEMNEVISVEKAYKAVQKFYKDKYNIGILHGKMDNTLKTENINKFNKGEIDILVATSIIEVGIDVPNVSVIAILSADRFGLSQLHQLRGRTGRSSIKSYCFLVSNNKSETTIERMKVIVNNHNGHDIALADLKLRGPGDYFGFNQHGYGNIKFIDPIKDKKLFDQAKETIKLVFKSNLAEDMQCKDYLLRKFSEETKLISMT